MYSKQKHRKALFNSVKNQNFRIFLKLTFLERAKYSLETNAEVNGRASSSKETEQRSLALFVSISTTIILTLYRKQIRKDAQRWRKDRLRVRIFLGFFLLCILSGLGVEEVRNWEISISADEKNSNKSLPTVRWQIKDKKLKMWWTPTVAYHWSLQGKKF